MKFDRGSIFLGFLGLVVIVLIIALTAAMITSPSQSSRQLQSSQMPGNGDAPALIVTNDMPEPAQPVVKTANYPGFSTSYRTEIYTGDCTIKNLVLNADGTISAGAQVRSMFTIFSSITGGHWYKVKEKAIRSTSTADLFQGRLVLRLRLLQIYMPGG